jgi:protein phosphatase 1L
VGKSGENQDSYIASNNSSGSKCLVGVFDGHGQQGKRISEFAKVQIAKNLFNSKELHSNPVSALEGAYAGAQEQIERFHGGEALHSGTTAISAYQHRDRLIIANVGDSRAVLGRSGSRENMHAVELSSDQKPCRADERKRILSAGGVVQQSQYPVRQTPGGPPRFMRAGPERVWDRTGSCGLGVARSLGDLAMHPFVVAYPEIQERQIDTKDKVLILGSDGVWDRLRSQEAVDIAARHNDPSAAAREITDVARKRWHLETQGQVSDDITAVVVRLDHAADARDSAAPHAIAESTMQVPKSRASCAAGMGAGRPSSVSNDMSMRLTGRPRRRIAEGGARNRKLPVHDWKGPI